MITVINKGFETETIYINKDKMNNINKRSDLHREYARVLDMVEGTNVKPFECVKHVIGTTVGKFFGEPEFNQIPSDYQFAISIVEDKPVFIGDELYWKSGNNSKYKIKSITDDGWLVTDDNGIFHIMGASWNPPKPKTFNLNGVDITKPSYVSLINHGQCGKDLFEVEYNLKFHLSGSECDKFNDLLLKM